MSKPFWEFPLMGQADGFETWWAEAGLAQKALEEHLTVHHLSRTGTLNEGVDVADVVEKLKGLGWLVYHKHGPKEDDLFFVEVDRAVNLSYNHGSRSVVLSGCVLEDTHLQALRDLADACIVRTVTRGRVYVVISTSDGPQVRELGAAGEVFEPGNYRPEVVEHYDHVAKDLGAKDPCGRIVILDGPPGTGKTHMVRALLNAVPNATFVLVQANVVSQLGSPSLVTALLDHQQRDQPVVLVIEDADECLASRKVDNLSEISALLNLSDGIFGALLDLRVIATTNVDIGKLDEAVVRDGRLCRRIEVGLLDGAQANAVYRRLTGKAEDPFGKGYHALSEAYKAARGAVPKEHKEPRRKVGFRFEEEPPGFALGLKPGDVFRTDDGTLVRVRKDGHLEKEDDAKVGDTLVEVLDDG